MATDDTNELTDDNPLAPTKLLAAERAGDHNHLPVADFAYDFIPAWVQDRPEELHAFCLFHPSAINDLTLTDNERLDIITRELAEIVATLPEALREAGVRYLLGAIRAGDILGSLWATATYRDGQVCGCIIGSLYTQLIPWDAYPDPDERAIEISDTIERHADELRPVHADWDEDWGIYGNYGDGKPYWRRIRPIELYANNIRLDETPATNHKLQLLEFVCEQWLLDHGYRLPAATP